MKQIDEQLMQEMIEATKTGADISSWKKNRDTAPLLSVIEELQSMPRTTVPTGDLGRVKNQMLDRIAVSVGTSQGWFATLMPRLVKFGVLGFGSVLIVGSLGLGTAVAALESVPGQTIYPLKQVVENVQLKLASEDEIATLQLKFANKRIEELERILEQKEEGKISEEEAQKVLATTIQNLKETTDAAAVAAASEPKIVDKLADISNKLKSASIQTEGEAKVELEKAVAATQISQSEAIKNIESAGLRIENKPIAIPGSVSASGEITGVNSIGITIGSTTFLFSENTIYEDITREELNEGLIVDIEGEVINNKTYAVKIIFISDPNAETENGETSGVNKDEKIIEEETEDEEVEIVEPQ